MGEHDYNAGTFTTYGGMEIRGEVKSLNKRTDKNGKETYEVIWKNGTKAVYPKQNPNNNASILAGPPMYSTDDLYDGLETSTFLSNGYNVTIFGTKQSDYISLQGCNRCTVDASQNDGQADHVVIADNTYYLNPTNRRRSQNNTARTNTGDTVRIFHEGTRTEPNSNGKEVPIKYHEKRGVFDFNGKRTVREQD